MSSSWSEIININIIKFYHHLFRHEKLFFKEKGCKQTVSLGGYGDWKKKNLENIDDYKKLFINPAFANMKSISNNKIYESNSIITYEKHVSPSTITT